MAVYRLTFERCILAYVLLVEFGCSGIRQSTRKGDALAYVLYRDGYSAEPKTSEPPDLVLLPDGRIVPISPVAGTDPMKLAALQHLTEQCGDDGSDRVSGSFPPNRGPRIRVSGTLTHDTPPTRAERDASVFVLEDWHVETPFEVRACPTGAARSIDIDGNLSCVIGNDMTIESTMRTVRTPNEARCPPFIYGDVVVDLNPFFRGAGAP